MKSYQIMRIGAYIEKFLLPIGIAFVLAVIICLLGYYLYKKHKEKKENEYEE